MHEPVILLLWAISPMTHALSLLQPWLASYGAFTLFHYHYFESFGAPLPGETALVAASALALRGDLALVAVLAGAWCGAAFGDSIGYAIG
jgi:membrane protein DedA with SNARE-associated domain